MPCLRSMRKQYARLPNKALQQTGLSVATLPLAPAAERRYVGRTTEARRLPAEQNLPL
jgi:hypothetical protein